MIIFFLALYLVCGFLSGLGLAKLEGLNSTMPWYKPFMFIATLLGPITAITYLYKEITTL